MSREFLRLEDHGGVVRLVLTRPPLNVLHIPMLRELKEAVEEVGRDGGARALVLTGSGRGFCAGVDVADHVEERVATTLRLFHDAVRLLLELELPVVAAVHGPALGGGCELALACDVVLASEGAKFGQPEVRLGAMPPVAAALLPRLVGRQRALDLILTGRILEAREASAIGLVTRVFPADEFGEEVEAYARGLASLSRPVLVLAKRAVREGLEQDVAGALEAAEALYLDELVRLEDAREGLEAFMEKREPAWRHA